MSAVPTHPVLRPIRAFPPTPLLGIARPGWPIIGVFLIVWALSTAAVLQLPGAWGAWSGWAVGVAGFVLTAWCVWFFRDPTRRTPGEAGLVISPADGVVCMVRTASPPEELGLGGEFRATRVSVFMNVFNVHVNRSPTDGVIERLAYHPGRFFNASFDKASDLNERLSMVLRLGDGRRCVAVQIAGLVARRIVCHAGEGMSVGRGVRYGMIRFGSRVDVYLPGGSEPVVAVGDRVIAGETVIARDADGVLAAAGVGHDRSLRAERESPRGSDDSGD
jgi:phosphatidylserine decarboxylase